MLIKEWRRDVFNKTKRNLVRASLGDVDTFKDLARQLHSYLSLNIERDSEASHEIDECRTREWFGSLAYEPRAHGQQRALHDMCLCIVLRLQICWAIEVDNMNRGE